MCCEYHSPVLLFRACYLQFYRLRCFVQSVEEEEKREKLPSHFLAISAVAVLAKPRQFHFASTTLPTHILHVSIGIGTNMLARPGEARQKSTPNTQRRKKLTSEDPNDTVRRLQRLPPNKACADCTSKPAQCVNLNHGTFVCMACSGVQ